MSPINLINELTVVAFPAVIPKFTTLVLLAREADEPDTVGITFRVNLNDQGLLSQQVQLQFGDRLKARAIAELQGLALTGPGNLRVAVYHDDRELAGWVIVKGDSLMSR